MTQWGLDTLFNPAKRHMDEEKRRLQSTRAEVGDNSGGKRIDLESGKVVIARTSDDQTSDDETSKDGGSGRKSKRAKEATAATAAQPGKKTEKSAPSPAAVRAAERRGRKPR